MNKILKSGLFNRCLKFSIRKLSVGVASLVIGAFWVGSSATPTFADTVTTGDLTHSPLVQYHYVTQDELTAEEEQLIQNGLPQNHDVHCHNYYLVYRPTSQGILPKTASESLSLLTMAGEVLFVVLGLSVIVTSKGKKERIVSSIMLITLSGTIFMPSIQALQTQKLSAYNQVYQVSTGDKLPEIAEIPGYQYVGYISLCGCQAKDSQTSTQLLPELPVEPSSDVSRASSVSAVDTLPSSATQIEATGESVVEESVSETEVLLADSTTSSSSEVTPVVKPTVPESSKSETVESEVVSVPSSTQAIVKEEVVSVPSSTQSVVKEEVVSVPSSTHSVVKEEVVSVPSSTQAIVKEEVVSVPSSTQAIVKEEVVSVPSSTQAIVKEEMVITVPTSTEVIIKEDVVTTIPTESTLIETSETTISTENEAGEVETSVTEVETVVTVPTSTEVVTEVETVVTVPTSTEVVTEVETVVTVPTSTEVVTEVETVVTVPTSTEVVTEVETVVTVPTSTEAVTEVETVVTVPTSTEVVTEVETVVTVPTSTEAVTEVEPVEESSSGSELPTSSSSSEESSSSSELPVSSSSSEEPSSSNELPTSSSSSEESLSSSELPTSSSSSEESSSSSELPVSSSPLEESSSSSELPISSSSSEEPSSSNELPTSSSSSEESSSSSELPTSSSSSEESSSSSELPTSSSSSEESSSSSELPTSSSSSEESSSSSELPVSSSPLEESSSSSELPVSSSSSEEPSSSNELPTSSSSSEESSSSSELPTSSSSSEESSSSSELPVSSSPLEESSSSSELPVSSSSSEEPSSSNELPTSSSSSEESSSSSEVPVSSSSSEESSSSSELPTSSSSLEESSSSSEVTEEPVVNKEELRQLVEEDKSLKETVRYAYATLEVKQSYDELLVKAQQLLLDNQATQEQVDAGLLSLKEAIERLNGRLYREPELVLTGVEKDDDGRTATLTFSLSDEDGTYRSALVKVYQEDQLVKEVSVSDISQPLTVDGLAYEVPYRFETALTYDLRDGDQTKTISHDQTVTLALKQEPELVLTGVEKDDDGRTATLTFSLNDEDGTYRSALVKVYQEDQLVKEVSVSDISQPLKVDGLTYEVPYRFETELTYDLRDGDQTKTISHDQTVTLALKQEPELVLTGVEKDDDGRTATLTFSLNDEDGTYRSALVKVYQEDQLVKEVSVSDISQPLTVDGLTYEVPYRFETALTYDLRDGDQTKTISHDQTVTLTLKQEPELVLTKVEKDDDGRTATLTFSLSDEDGTYRSALVKVYQEDQLVKEVSVSDISQPLTVDGLAYEVPYRFETALTYDLRDGDQTKTISHDQTVTLALKQEPELVLTGVEKDDDDRTATLTFSLSDEDGTYRSALVKVYQEDQLVKEVSVSDISQPLTVDGLAYELPYRFETALTYDLRDGDQTKTISHDQTVTLALKQEPELVLTGVEKDDDGRAATLTFSLSDEDGTYRSALVKVYQEDQLVKEVSVTDVSQPLTVDGLAYEVPYRFETALTYDLRDGDQTKTISHDQTVTLDLKQKPELTLTQVEKDDDARTAALTFALTDPDDTYRSTLIKVYQEDQLVKEVSVSDISQPLTVDGLAYEVPYRFETALTYDLRDGDQTKTISHDQTVTLALKQEPELVLTGVEKDDDGRTATLTFSLSDEDGTYRSALVKVYQEDQLVKEVSVSDISQPLTVDDLTYEVPYRFETALTYDLRDGDQTKTISHDQTVTLALKQEPELVLTGVEKDNLTKSLSLSYQLTDPDQAYVSAVAKIYDGDSLVKELALTDLSQPVRVEGLDYNIPYTIKTDLVYDRRDGDQTKTDTYEETVELTLKQVVFKDLTQVTLYKYENNQLVKQETASPTDDLSAYVVKLESDKYKDVYLAVSSITEDGKVRVVWPELVQDKTIENIYQEGLELTLGQQVNSTDYSQLAQYESSRQVAYQNIEKLLPFYNKEIILDYGNKVSESSKLYTTPLVNVVPMVDNAFVTDYYGQHEQINRLMLHYSDDTVEYVDLTAGQFFKDSQ
ncbi:ZmpA/ZmpB/ZmpC family metallo-endopeptidase-related protein, partial [Streptococcus sp. sy018]|uniref:ZmpA/ZmpB/ZmpC family metallo-endopeptidase-related protein n=1 Tax=Streptococcus sp. sy018 TaxID=2600147 RepID=UPI001648C380